MSKPTLEERVAVLSSRMEDVEEILVRSGIAKMTITAIPDDRIRFSFNAPETTSDPQEPYRLDTKPRDGVHARVTEWTEDMSGPQEPYKPILPQHVVEGMELLKEQLVRARNPGTPYVMAIDPKASPKGIPFSVALEYVRAGRRIKRSEQRHDGIGLIKGSGHTFMECNVGDKKHDIESAMWDDILANDWEVVPEP